MIQVFDTAAAGVALARRKLGCPDSGRPLRPWGHACARTVRDLAVRVGTVRDWIRGARQSAARLRITGIRTVMASGQDALPARACRTPARGR